jgi:3-hydroxybutyryl-CoA dehydrogenase
MERTLKRITIIGGGTMGVGIAYVSAQAGGAVTIVEPNAVRATGLRSDIANATASAVKRGKLTNAEALALGERIETISALAGIQNTQDLIVESVPEDFELKSGVLIEAAEQAPRLLATNTSAISIDRLAAILPKPELFLGMHFFNPVWSLKLVELVEGRATSAAAMDDARAISVWMGKETLTVRDIPGFATSRLDLIASLEAMRMVESGVATAEDIDRAATLAYRHPAGPLRLSDIVGLDVRLDVARALEAAHGSRFAPPKILEDMVRAGKLGVKSGHGFFDWPAEYNGVI